ncbi:unnamed protein product, partial [Protopolystoma xenopodis]
MKVSHIFGVATNFRLINYDESTLLTGRKCVHIPQVEAELEEMADRLEEQGGATAQQVDLNKKREAEMMKLKRDLEDARLQNEQQIAAMRKKQGDSVNELSDQLDQSNKARTRQVENSPFVDLIPFQQLMLSSATLVPSAEKERNDLKGVIEDLHAQIEQLSKGKINAEKTVKTLDCQVIELTSKLDESNQQLSEFSSSKSRSSQEVADLIRQLEEAESQISQLTKLKLQLAGQVDEARKNLEDESRIKAKLNGEVRGLTGDLDSLRESLEE